jgi:hypothetical protein
MNIRSLIPLSFLALALFTSGMAQADATGYIGGMVGLSVPDADHTTSRLGYGVKGGALLGTEFGVSGYYVTSTKEEKFSGSTFDFGYDMFGIEGSYNFEGEAKGAFFGARLGMTKVKVGDDVSTSPMHYGLVAGYDHMLGDAFSIGGEASWTSVAKSDDNGFDVKGFNVIGLMATIKMWF